MNKIVLILMFVTFALNAQWVKVSGIENLSIEAFSVMGDNLLVGTNGHGIYRLTSTSRTLTQLTLLNNRSVSSLKTNGNNIYAGTYFGLYLSTNGGSNWSQTSLNNPVMSLALIGNNIYAGTNENGVYLSTNNGTSWTQTSLNNCPVWELAVNGNNIFAGTNSYGIYLSTNSGITWFQTSLDSLNVNSLAVNGSNVFAGVGLGNNTHVYLSTNNGTTWSQTSLGTEFYLSLAINGNTIFAGSYYNGVFVSYNNGVSWIQRNEGLNDSTIRAFCILNNSIFAGTQNGVYRRPLNEIIGIHSISTDIPNQFSLSQNYPNPFNPNTKIQFTLPKSSFAMLVIYDALGKEVGTLVNEKLNAGTYEADWSADKFSSGVYYYKLTTDDFTETKKMVLMK